MKPILYESTEAQFTSNGLGRLADCIDCTVTEERNGIYECQFSYPVTGAMYSQIQIGRILGVIHDDVKDVQPFDIYAKSAPLDGVVTFYAHHISYRLGHVILKPMEASSCAAAFAAIPAYTYNNCQFTFWTDKAVAANWQNKTPSAVKAILGGQQGSILDVYGKGEYMWDRWLVRLYTNRGSDNGVSIRYGVNLTELQQELDDSGSYNAVAPYWVSREDGTVVTLTKGIVAVNTGTRLVPWTTKSGEEITDRAGNTIYFKVGVPVTPIPMDLSEAFEEQPTEAQLETEALRRLNSSEAWLPSENITVSFINLADTEEYKSVAALQRVSLCDKVSVYCGPLNVSAVKMQVIRVVYNVLTERYDEIELGKPKTSFAQTITAKIEEVTKDLPTTSMMQRAINNATDKITGAMGGYVRFIYDANGEMQEILIMDTDDINTAVKVWRWNSGGFGFSSNGYDGPYALAMTMDGAIVADFITAGTLLANIIKAGILSDENGKNFWNMETGEFSLSASTTVGGSTVDSIAQNKANNAISAFDNSLNQQSVFNRLTNNGQTQGIYLKNGKLYINATYIDTGTLLANIIKGGTLTLGGGGNVNGALIVEDASGNIIGTWSKDGISILKGSIEGANITLGGSNNQYGSIEMLSGTGLGNGGWNINGITVGGTNNSSSKIGFNRYDGTVKVAYIDLRTYGRIATDEKCQAMRICVNKGQSGQEQEFVDFDGGAPMDNVAPLTTFRTRVLLSSGNLDVLDDLSVSGTKSRAVSTDQYSERLLYCYETPSPLFGDVGEGVIGEDGYCYVTLDAIFAQTITTYQYQVFLQKYGPGDCWVKDRRGGYFIIEGTTGLAFGWEIKAKQADYDQLRLERNDEKFTIPTQTYGEDAAKHIDDIQKERIPA